MLKDGEKLSMGKLYYNDLQVKFLNPDAPPKQLDLPIKYENQDITPCRTMPCACEG